MKKETIKESILNPVSMFIIGLLTGFLIKEIGINLLLGSFIKIYDIVFIGILIYLLFIKKYTKICIYRNFNLSAVHKKIYEDLICTGKPENLKKI